MQEEKTKEENTADKLLKTRSVLLSGEINKDTADKVIKQLLILEGESKTEPVYFYIDSPGGDVDAGFAIYDMIRFISCPVITIGMGLIASAGSLVLLSVPAERRVGLPNSSYLIHQPLSKMRGNATEIEIHAKQLELCKEKINKIISEATGQSLDKVAADTDRDYWLNAEEAEKYGLISKIIENRTDL